MKFFSSFTTLKTFFESVAEFMSKDSPFPEKANPPTDFRTWAVWPPPWLQEGQDISICFHSKNLL